MFTGTSICMFVLLQHRSKPSWHQNQPSFKLLARPPSRQPGAAARPGTEGLPDPPPSTQATAANMPPTVTGWRMLYVVQACSDILCDLALVTYFCLILKCCYNLLQRQSHTSLPPPYCWLSFPPCAGRRRVRSRSWEPGSLAPLPASRRPTTRPTRSQTTGGAGGGGGLAHPRKNREEFRKALVNLIM